MIVLAAAFLSCGRHERETAPAVSDVPVFIISIDTLRADRLGAYGYSKGSTPAIDAFRRDAILFSEAHAQCPLTLPSHATLFTGKAPYAHGVRNNLGYTLEPSHATLASILKQNGYETGAAVSSFVLRKETGIAAGFDFFDDFMTHSPLESATSWQRDGDLSRVALTRWLDSTRSRKVLGFLHLYEPHSPYTPPERFSAIRDRYDGEIAHADSIVGAFLDELRRRDLYHSSLVIVLSDHGEGLGDHGEQEHGVFLYRESIRVPLLLKLPGQQRGGETVDRTVGLMDVMPTVLAITNGQTDSSGLLATRVGARHVYSESYYPRLQYGWSELQSMVGDEFHYIHAPRVELYRHRTDAAERTNVAEENRRELAAFREEIRRIREAHPFSEPRAVDPEDVKKLAALGYVGSTVSVSGDLPDPKDKLDLLRTFGAANDAFRSGRFAHAAATMEVLMRENPDFISGWGLLAQTYRQLGKRELALTALKTQMNRAPGSAQVALTIAELLLEMGRYREAREHAALAVASGGVIAHETLAMIALAERDLVAAEQHIAASLAREPDRIQALLLLSQVRRLQQRFPEELASLERAREVIERRRMPAVRDLELRRGEALLQSGKVAEAEGALRAETSTFPANLTAWAKLALVVGAQGRRDEARAILNEAIRRNPGAASRDLARKTLLTMNDEAGARDLGRSRQR